MEGVLLSESLLHWSSYLMIVAVVVFTLNGIFVTKPDNRRLSSLFRYVVFPVTPIVVFILIFLLLAMPDNFNKLTQFELKLFEYGIQTVVAGISVYLTLVFAGVLNSGVNRTIKKIRLLTTRKR